MLLTFPVTINGYFEGEYVSQKSRLPVAWDMWNPKNYFEMKISAKPFPGIDAYTSMAALSNGNGTRLYLNQGHITFHRSNFEITYFSREDRYWISSPLLFLVQTDRVKDDSWGPKGEGFRYDFWDIFKFRGAIIGSKFKTWDGEAYLAYLERPITRFFQLGTIYLKKDWRGGDPPTFNSVYSLNGKLHVKGPLNLRFEVAKSIHPAQITQKKSDDYAYEIELRSVRIKNILIAGNLFNYGLDFIDEFSNKFNKDFDREFDRKGVYGEIIYLVPGKAINLVYKTKWYKSRYDESKIPPVRETYYSRWWNYGEIYMEYYGGVNSRFFVESTIDTQETWNHLYFEVGGENNVMKLRLQYKIMDIGINRKGRSVFYSIGERHLVGVELRVNITDYLHFYGRSAIGMGTGRDWESLFLQLAYRRFQNTEILLEYGEPSHTDGDIVNDWDIAYNPYQRVEDRVKLLVKFWF